MKRLIRFFIRTIPRPILIKFSFAFSWIIRLFYKGNKVECPICESTFRKFLPYGVVPRANVLCPKCLSLERHRMMWVYLKERTPFFTDKLKVLHIAPEQCFYKKFRALENLDYTTGDLESPIADVHFDVLDIPFEENTYDVIFCNHVLEHVKDDQKAMKEIKRILKPGGFAILQVPQDWNLETTYEDDSITDRKEREKHFGQYDHLRMYGNDYPKQLEKAGFKVTEVTMRKEFEGVAERYRFPEKEPIYRCDKVA